MNRDVIKMFEMFGKLNSDFKIKLNESDTFTDTFNSDTFDSSITTSTATQQPISNTQTTTSQPITGNQQNIQIDGSSIVDDGTLSVGELRTFINILQKSKNKEEALAKVKEVGGDVLKIGLGLLPVVGNIIGVSADTVSVFKKLFAPKTGSSTKEPNEFMKLLQIDNEVSILLDDKIEYAFISYAVNLLDTLSDTDPVPDFFDKLKEFIKEKYSAIYNLTKA